MDVRCPECGCRDFVLFNEDYMCCNCNREFGPKCPECGTEMDPYNKQVWICPCCRHEVEFSEIELPKVDPAIYLLAAKKKARSRKPKSSGSGESFLGFVWKELCNNFSEMVDSMMNSQKK